MVKNQLASLAIRSYPKKNAGRMYRKLPPQPFRKLPLRMTAQKGNDRGLVGGFETTTAWKGHDVARYEQTKHEATGHNAEGRAGDYET